MKTAKLTEAMPVNLNEVTQNNIVFGQRNNSAVLCDDTTIFYCYVISEIGWCFKIWKTNKLNAKYYGYKEALCSGIELVIWWLKNCKIPKKAQKFKRSDTECLDVFPGLSKTDSVWRISRFFFLSKTKIYRVL